ncbi:M23 family metallopeptidase [Sphingomonas sp.]|uniref:M23 family metallopeptidase n=1 Tax=Sphingomonas sp. TaxID=28214 RepID=UPI001D1FB17A|nr:M23 family metallopeptidase [Sphingomonas sp.]MBX9797183.1 M23 family metallopeptidase [Sphingomonas sp.]
MILFKSLRFADLAHQVKGQFKTRDFILHDGHSLRRFSVAGRTQAALAIGAGVTLCFTAYGATQAAASAVALSGVLGGPQGEAAALARLQGEVAAMQAKVEAIKHAAKVHAARVEQRQALIAAVLSGESNGKLALNTPLIDAKTNAVAADVVAPLTKVERDQLALAVRARLVAERRYALAANHFRRLGIAPERFQARAGGQGGPYEPVTGVQAAEANAEAEFRSLFMTWKKLETLEQAVIAIPAMQPVDKVSFTSTFGVRSDPFRGTPAMHAGVDIPGAQGTPVYATADGVIARAERSGGYGNMVEINHGRGIATRYGHLSKIMIAPNTRVTRGQLIGLMGSTGRSTGTHLHYEVRIDGQAVNPIPFLQTSDVLKGATPVEHPLVAGGSDAAN